MKIITKKKEEKMLKEDTYSLDYTLTKWLNIRLKAYLNYASKYVDLEYYKYKYKNKEYTQLEILNRLIEITDTLVDESFYWGIESKKAMKLIDEMYDLLKIIHFALWW